jgi:hypothetical protein
MKRLVEFPSDTGELILVEVEDVGFGGETRRGLSAPWKRHGPWQPAWWGNCVR